jgi:hypothetical protein
MGTMQPRRAPGASTGHRPPRRTGPPAPRIPPPADDGHGAAGARKPPVRRSPSPRTRRRYRQPDAARRRRCRQASENSHPRSPPDDPNPSRLSLLHDPQITPPGPSDTAVSTSGSLDPGHEPNLGRRCPRTSRRHHERSLMSAAPASRSGADRSRSQALTAAAATLGK